MYKDEILMGEDCGCKLEHNELILCRYHSKLGQVPKNWDEIDANREKDER